MLGSQCVADIRHVIDTNEIKNWFVMLMFAVKQFSPRYSNEALQSCTIYFNEFVYGKTAADCRKLLNY